MSDIAEPNSPGMFDPEKGFYEAGEIVMSEQERIIQEEVITVINAAEHILYVNAPRQAGTDHETNSTIPQANLLELGAVIVGSIVVSSILDSLFGKKTKET